MREPNFVKDPALKHVKEIMQSRTYREMREYLIWRREALFQEEPTTTEALWKNRGAIEEVTRQLQGRELYLAYLKFKEDTPEQMDTLVGRTIPNPGWVGIEESEQT